MQIKRDLFRPRFITNQIIPNRLDSVSSPNSIELKIAAIYFQFNKFSMECMVSNGLTINPLEIIKKLTTTTS